jgi:hypothetical protein
MGTGSKLRFFREGDISWSPNIAHGTAAGKFPELSMIDPRPDPLLTNIWADMREFSRAANEATYTNIKMHPRFFARLSTSAPYRIINLEYDPTSIHELLRLSMLAYMKGILIQIEGIGKKMTYLTKGLELAILARDYPPDSKQAGFILWTLFMAGLSIFEDFDQFWLHAAILQTLSVLSIRTWEELRTVLKCFLWIDCIFDSRGKMMFERWFGPTALALS